MDTNPGELYDLIKGKSCDYSYSPQDTTSMYGLPEPQPLLYSADTSFLQTIGDNNSEFCEYTSDAVLNYISRMLLEEGIDEKVGMYQQDAGLRAVEKPFYDILGQKYPPSPGRLSPHSHQSSMRSGSSDGQSNNSISNNGLADNSRAHHFADHSNAIDISSHRLLSLSVGVGKRIEEAKKFLPTIDELLIDFEANTLSFHQNPKKDSPLVEVKVGEEEDEKEHLIYGSKCRKNPYDDDLGFWEGRSSKQSAVYSDDPIRNEMIDNVLLNIQGEKHVEDVIQLRELMENESSKNSLNGLAKGSNGGKKRGKKKTKVVVVDLRILLMHCAQAVAIDDHYTAIKLLKQIREHSSPNGDGCQRVAHWFADGLEARLAGTGSQIYHKLMPKRSTTSDMMKTIHLLIAASPFVRACNYFCNQTILNVIEKASKVHIVDFGIEFSFHWPSLIQRLSRREGGPPKLRITGIDIPQSGFRPTQQVEEGGRRLADYAGEFQVPFEYQFIASKWETIRVEDINIDEDEVLIVSSLFCFRNVVDQTGETDNPRDRVLKTIKQMNPSVFILGIINGSYGGPFFVTRFREALFRFTSFFDMFDTNIPRDNKQRLVIEKDICGSCAINVIACEGAERVERPETYKQWQVRIIRAGFMQLPPTPAMMKYMKDKATALYHKDFMVDDDSQWLLQGWKGRILYALSAWKPSQI